MGTCKLSEEHFPLGSGSIHIPAPCLPAAKLAGEDCKLIWEALAEDKSWVKFHQQKEKVYIYCVIRTTIVCPRNYFQTIINVNKNHYLLYYGSLINFKKIKGFFDFEA